ncbi:MAG: hypothetical protein JW867_02970 [Candidatus Omnitrophica bacterium]|nr:hypothetical protein [Candidatus Omnitrophota bacterium]
MKSTAKIKTAILFLFFLQILCIELFAQEEQTLKPLRILDSKESFFEKKIAFGKDVVANCGYLETFLIYQAVRDEDLSLCNQESSRQIAGLLLALRYAGENRCQNIDNPEFQGLCQAVNSGSCGELAGWKKSFCEISIKNEVDSLAQLASSKEAKDFFSLPLPIENDTVLLGLGVFHGFKHYSQMACEQFIKNSSLPLSWRLCCDLIFAGDFEKEKDSLIRDLSLFILDREMGEPGQCQDMSNKLVRDACFDKNNKTLSDAW